MTGSWGCPVVLKLVEEGSAGRRALHRSNTMWPLTGRLAGGQEDPPKHSGRLIRAARGPGGAGGHPRLTSHWLARAMFRVAVSGRREQEASFFTVVVWRDQADHACESSRRKPVVVVGRLQQRSWTAEDGSARSAVGVVAEELGPSLRWATATTTRTTRSQER